MQQQPVLNLIETPVFSVTQLSQTLKKTVEQSFSRVRVRGEISGFKRHTSGHLYFSLKDQESVIDGVCWRGTPLQIQLEDGLEIIANGRITIYPGRSKYQIVVDSFEAAGEGALLKLLLDRKNRLMAEGLFDPIRKKQLPRYPQTIGVITSPTGAVIRDILHRLQDRYPCRVLVWPVAVQGNEAADQVATAIKGFNRLLQSQPELAPDVLIVARGGGSLEDLWAFNEEIVVRAVADSQIPIISAIGHETDTTLIDFSADVRAPTPTAAAEISVPVRSELLQRILERQHRQSSALSQIIERAHLTLSSLSLLDPNRMIEDKMQRLDDWLERLTTVKTSFLQQHSKKLEFLSARVRHPNDLIQSSHQSLEFLSHKFKGVASRLVEDAQHELELLTSKLDQNSYEKILEKGFCWVSDTANKPISRAEQIQGNTDITLHFVDGDVPLSVQRR